MHNSLLIVAIRNQSSEHDSQKQAITSGLHRETRVNRAQNPVGDERGLELLSALRPPEFKWISAYKHRRSDAAIIEQLIYLQ
jgi:hypothetical protein